MTMNNMLVAEPIPYACMYGIGDAPVRNGFASMFTSPSTHFFCHLCDCPKKYIARYHDWLNTPHGASWCPARDHDDHLLRVAAASRKRKCEDRCGY